MYFNAVYIDCSLIRRQLSGTACRAMIFAVAAAYTYALVYDGTHVTVLSLNHGYSLGGTMADAVSTSLTVSGRDADFGVDNSSADFPCSLFLDRNGAQGSGGTYLRATVAVSTAETVGKDHYRLHEAVERSAGTKHIVGALAYAELTGSTVAAEMAQTDCSGRNSRSGIFMTFFSLDRSETAVGNFISGRCSRRTGYDSRAYKERAMAAVGLFSFVSGSSAFGGNGFLNSLTTEAVADSALCAVVDAVETYHTARQVDDMILCVDTFSLAFTAT